MVRAPAKTFILRRLRAVITWSSLGLGHMELYLDHYNLHLDDHGDHKDYQPTRYLCGRT